MKQLTLLVSLIASLITVAQNDFRGTPISLKSDKISIQEAINEIESQTDVTISFGNWSTDILIQVDTIMELSDLLDIMTAPSNQLWEIRGQKILVYPTKEKHKTYSGYIDDAETGEALVGVTIYDTVNRRGSVSNQYGFFSYTYPDDTASVLLISFVGYDPQFVLPGGPDEILSISLTPNTQELQEVIVSSDRIHKSQMNLVSVSPKEVQLLPSFMGVPDILRTITMMPGIKFGSDNATGFYVRGGGADQNLILMDGANIYNANHAFDLFSTFNASAIRNIDVIKGGFPARYGGRLSSVIDVNLKEGNNQHLTGEVGLGYLLSNFTIEGPIVDERTSFIVTGRRTFMDLILRNMDLEPENPNARTTQRIVFQDLSAKVNHEISEKDHVYLSYYQSGDLLGAHLREQFENDNGITKTSEKASMGWQNQILSARWNHQFGNKLFLNTNTSYSRFNVEIDVDQEELYDYPPDFSRNLLSESFNSSIQDYGLKAQFDYYPDRRQEIRFGLNGVHHVFDPGIRSISLSSQNQASVLDTIYNSQSTTSNELSFFIEDNVEITQRLYANVGVHTSTLWVDNQSYLSLQPRVSISYLPKPKWKVNASYARMNQFIHLLTNSTLGIPLDLWVPATSAAPPMSSSQWTLGINHKLGNQLSLSVESYYKEMDNLIAYREGANFVDSRTTWEQKIVTDGTGESYGVEWLLRKSVGKSTGWLGYTLSWTTRNFSELNNGRTFPYQYDRRHDINWVVVHKINEKIDLSGNWVFASGNVISVPVGTHLPLEVFPDAPDAQVSRNQPNVQIYDRINDVRLPNYHRMDLGINFHKERNRGTRTWNFSVINAYGRKNPFIVYIKDGPQSNAEESVQNRHFRQLSTFWFVPSFSYRFKFN